MGGRPDGIAVDADGHIWVTVFDQGCIAVFNAEGLRLNELGVPVADLHPASVEFIGECLKELLVVTGYPRVPDATRWRVEGDGQLFVVLTETQGLRATPWIEAPLPS